MLFWYYYMRVEQVQRIFLKGLAGFHKGRTAIGSEPEGLAQGRALGM